MTKARRKEHRWEALPIGVKAHLAPHVSNHSLIKLNGPDANNGAVSAAPWGSASILLISYGYIRMLGAHGVTEATRYAILNANYIARRLSSHYPILYTGANGMVAHECIIDIRPIQKETGISGAAIGAITSTTKCS